MTARANRRPLWAAWVVVGAMVAGTVPLVTADVAGADVVSPLSSLTVRMLNDNGAWSWWEDERAIMTTDGRLMVGSVAESHGTGGVGRDGATEVSTLDLRTGDSWVDQIHRGLDADDHNSPALVQLPGGRIVTAWTGHQQEARVRLAHQDPRSRSWEVDPPVERPESATPVDNGGFVSRAKVTYSNLVHLSAENGGRGRLYDFFRGQGDDPAVMVSDDGGRTWTHLGKVFHADTDRPYVRYVSDGRSRIHFLVSDGHPNTAVANRLYHGYIQGGSVYRSDGSRVGPLGKGLDPAYFTPVFRGRTGDQSKRLDEDAWSSDVELDAAGRPVVTFSVKLPLGEGQPVPGNRFDHRYWYGRWTGSAWEVNEIGYGGSELYREQPDYTGLAAVDPVNPDRIVMSTDVNPVTNAPLVSSADGRVHHELWEGRRATGRWTWLAITRNSTVDNIRPVIARSVGGFWALTWLRGTYTSFVDYDLDVVAVVEDPVAPPSTTPRPARWEVDGATQVVAGQFDGRPGTDLLRVTPGVGPDAFVFATSAGTAAGTTPGRYRTVTVNGSMQAVPVDFTCDGITDVQWVAGTGTSPRWRLSAGGVVQNLAPIATPVGSVALAGDFDADGCGDLLWHGPAGTELWWSSPGGTFSRQRVPVGGSYRPAVLDLDGNGADDVLWYAPGSAAEVSWTFSTSRRRTWVSRSASQVTGSYTVLAGDFDGNGLDDLFWYAPGSAADHVWFRTATGWVTRVVAVSGSYRPVVADLAGSPAADVWWYSATAADTLWTGGSSLLARSRR